MSTDPDAAPGAPTTDGSAPGSPERALIVFANPEPSSFGAALRDRAVAGLQAQGVEVEVSDLYAMGFEPVARGEDFRDRRFPDRLWYDREQQHAVRGRTLPDDVRAEVEKLQRADLVLLVFPLWWFSVPAIMKGWIDRTFVKEVAYGSARRYENGGFAGKRAMLVTTTNAWPGMLEPDGLMGDVEIVLWPLQNGVLAYTGFAVLPALVANAVAFVDDDARTAILEDLDARIRDWRTTEPIAFHRSDEVGEDWRLLPGVEPRVIGHRRPAREPDAAAGRTDAAPRSGRP